MSQEGEIHALLGENGAGKSTILKILNGVHTPSAGTIEVLGVALTEHSPDASRRAGIGMIFQEMSSIPTLTVAQNIFLNTNSRRVRASSMTEPRRSRARKLFADLGVDIDPSALVGDLSAGQRQLTEIVKAISQNVRVLILDEPTTALSGGEVGKLFAFLRRLKAEGVAIIYVSHRMEEITQHRRSRDDLARRTPRHHRAAVRAAAREDDRIYRRPALARVLRRGAQRDGARQAAAGAEGPQRPAKAGQSRSGRPRRRGRRHRRVCWAADAARSRACCSASIPSDRARS